jgi:hypothetical protein
VKLVSDIPQCLLPILCSKVLLNPNMPSKGDVEAYLANAVASSVIPCSFECEGTIDETSQLFYELVVSLFEAIIRCMHQPCAHKYKGHKD